LKKRDKKAFREQKEKMLGWGGSHFSISIFFTIHTFFAIFIRQN